MVDFLRQLEEARAAFGAVAAELENLRRAAEMCVECLAGGGTVFVCGNGGSSAQSLHLVEELTGRYKNNRSPLRAVALGGDAPALTCIANDFGYDEVFSRPLLALGRPGDVLFAFSTSGNSPSIVRALETARRRQIRSALLTGQSGGQCAALADCVLRVSSPDNARVQEVHTFFLHGILEAVEAAVVSGKISSHD